MLSGTWLECVFFLNVVSCLVDNSIVCEQQVLDIGRYSLTNYRSLIMIRNSLQEEYAGLLEYLISMPKTADNIGPSLTCIFVFVKMFLIQTGMLPADTNRL